MEERTLGDYRLIKPIGQGTMGIVYLAEHRFMKRFYALKILPEELSSDRGFIHRFEEEIGALASLDHPGIVKIYNISFDQGQYFLVTDCIVDELGETTNLAKYVMGLRRILGEEEVYSILLQIAAALDYAHSKKLASHEVVHRGLKPNNILVGKHLYPSANLLFSSKSSNFSAEPDQEGGMQSHSPSSLDVDRGTCKIYLSDFGLSRVIGPGAVLTRTYKSVAEALGIAHQVTQKTGQDRFPSPQIETQKLTPLHSSFLQNYAFLAPEQKRLDMPHPVDAKADVYAFGVLAYFLLMNELPEGVFDMPSSRGRLRYHWDSLITSCLQIHPVKRPLNLTQLLESSCQQQTEVFSNEVEDHKKIDFPKEDCQDILVELTSKFSAFKNEKISEPPIQEEINLSNSLVEQQHMEAGSADAFPTCEVKQLAANNTLKANLKPSLQTSLLERPQTNLDPGAIFQVSTSVKTYNPEPKDISDLKPLLTDMVIIPGGTFFRGSQDGNRDEMPKHQVTLSSFAIDIHPVTNEQFVRFLEVMGGEKDSNHNDIIRLRDSRIKRSGGKLSIESGYAKHPVVGVTWYGAVAYAKWIGKRLPTEAEWEIASRGNHESNLYPTGDDIEKTQANFFSSDTTAVMSYASNDYGLYDVAGNVYEWCHDWYGYNYYEISVQEPDNPHGPLQGVYRVLRGGCWKSLKEDLRCSRRHRNNPGTVNGTYGFRCVAGVQ